MSFCPAGTRVPDSTFCTAHAEDPVTGSNKLTGEVGKQEELNWKGMGRKATPMYLWLFHLHWAPPSATAPGAEPEEML